MCCPPCLRTFDWRDHLVLSLQARLLQPPTPTKEDHTEAQGAFDLFFSGFSTAERPLLSPLFPTSLTPCVPAPTESIQAGAGEERAAGGRSGQPGRGLTLLLFFFSIIPASAGSSGSVLRWEGCAPSPASTALHDLCGSPVSRAPRGETVSKLRGSPRRPENSRHAAEEAASASARRRYALALVYIQFHFSPPSLLTHSVCAPSSSSPPPPSSYFSLIFPSPTEQHRCNCNILCTAEHFVGSCTHLHTTFTPHIRHNL